MRGGGWCGGARVEFSPPAPVKQRDQMSSTAKPPQQAHLITHLSALMVPPKTVKHTTTLPRPRPHLSVTVVRQRQAA